MKRFFRMVLSVIIAVVMVTYLMPVGVFADDVTLSCPTVVHPEEKVTVSFAGAPTDTTVYVVMAPATAEENNDAVNKRLELIFLEGKSSGELTFTAPWEPGEYRFFMFINRDTVHLASSEILKVEQYKAEVSASPANPAPGGKVTVKYSGLPANGISAYIVTMPADSKPTAAAISNERLDLVYLDDKNSSGSVVMNAPAVPGKYIYRIVINRDTIIIGSSSTMQVSIPKPKAKLTVTPLKYKKKASITVSYTNAPLDQGTVYIVMMKKNSASTPKAVSNERLELKYIKGKSGKLAFTAPNSPGSYNFRMFVNKGTVLQAVSSNIEVY